MNTLDKFELYIEGSLSNKEVQDLEDEFRNNPELFEDFKEYNKVNHLLKRRLSSPLIDCKDDSILNQLSLNERLSIEEDVFNYRENPEPDLQENELHFRKLLSSIKIASKNRQNKRNLLLNIYIKIAAVIILGFLISTLIINNNELYNNQLISIQLFQKYYDPMHDKSLKPFDTYQVIMQKAIIDFRNADFAAADSNLEMISKDYDTEYMYHIIKGLILLEEGKPENAKGYFKTAMSEAVNDNRFVAKWYLGLTYLKENNSSDALPLFKDLSQVQNRYKREAKRILKAVKLE
jgi:hypothetical protein